MSMQFGKIIFFAFSCYLFCSSSWAITNGAPTDFYRRPYFVKIHLKNGYCGGVILNKNRILTAAHCVKGPWGHPLFVSGGGNGRTSALSNLGNIAAYTYHKQYAAEPTTANDIAIIVLSEEISFSQDIQSISLPDPQLYESLLDRNVTAIGYGNLSDNTKNDGQLREIDLPLAPSHTQSEFWLRSLGNDVARFEVFVKNLGDSVFFTFPEMERGPCDGDSGGPLIVTYKGTDYLVGIISAVYGRCGRMAKYTSTFHFRNWIEERL